MLAEAHHALKMEHLADALAKALQDNFRTNRMYPDQLSDFRFDNCHVFAELGINQADLNNLKYYSDASGFLLTYETKHFRFILTGHKMNGISHFEPMSRKVDS